MLHRHRWIAVAGVALLAALPSRGTAQFTTYIAPPNKVKDSVKAAIVAEQKASQDSVTRAQIADMKTWVDSASGVAVPSTFTDSTTPPMTPPTTSFANGSVAPSTASPLPSLVVFGLSGLVLGVLLLRRPPRAEEIARRHRR